MLRQHTLLKALLALRFRVKSADRATRKDMADFGCSLEPTSHDIALDANQNMPNDKYNI
jgi:hypothetical protein